MIARLIAGILAVNFAVLACFLLEYGGGRAVQGHAPGIWRVLGFASILAAAVAFSHVM